MGKVKVLIVGGYGKVGSSAAKLLSEEKGVELTIGGRNLEKAKKKAASLNARGIFIDAGNPQSVDEAVKDQDIILNCFIGLGKPNMLLPEAAVQYGKKYLDIAGLPAEHLQAVLDLHEKGKNKNSLLITGLGLYPGATGIILKNHGEYFDHIQESDIYFTMGSNLDDLSLLSLRGVGMLMRAPALAWEKNGWKKPAQGMKSYYIAQPFNKTIYFGAGMATPDLTDLPKNYQIERLHIWSGMESLLQSTLFILGAHLGFTESDKKGEKLLKLLQRIGKNKKFHEDTNLKVVSRGIKDGKEIKRTTTFYCSEVLATALTGVIACKQVIRKMIPHRGAYISSETVDPGDFMEQLEQADVNLTDEVIDEKKVCSAP